MQGLLRQYCYQTALIQIKTRQPNSFQNQHLTSSSKSALTSKVQLAGTQIRKRTPKTQKPPTSSKDTVIPQLASNPQPVSNPPIIRPQPVRNSQIIIPQLTRNPQIMIYQEISSPKIIRPQIVSNQQILRSHIVTKCDEFQQQTNKPIFINRRNQKASYVKERREAGQKLNTSLFSNQKMRRKITSNQAMYPQQYSNSNIGWRIRDKLSKTQQHMQIQENQKHSDTVKQFKKINQTTLYVARNQEESTFLELMKKFRFQNLKDLVVPQLKKPPFFILQTKMHQSRQASISHIGHHQNQRRHEEKVAYHETSSTTIYHQPQRGQPNQDRRASKQTKNERSIVNQIKQERSMFNQHQYERSVANKNKLQLSPWQISDCMQIWQ